MKKRLWFCVFILVLLSVACSSNTVSQVEETPLSTQAKYSIEEYGSISEPVWVEQTGDWIYPVGTLAQSEQDCSDQEVYSWSYVPGQEGTVFRCHPFVTASFCIDGFNLVYPVGPDWNGEVTEEIRNYDFENSQMPVGANPNITVGECEPDENEIVLSESTGK